MTARKGRIALPLVAAALVAGILLLPIIGFYGGAVGEHLSGSRPLELPPAIAFLRSIVLAGAAAIIALLLGVPVALAIARIRSPLGRVLPFLAIVPLAIPPTIQAHAWMIFPGGESGPSAVIRSLIGASPGGMALGATAWGAGLVLGVCLWPIVAFLGAAGLLAGGGGMEEAGAPYAGERRILWRIVLPGMWPSALVGAALVYWMALANFSVPNLLLVPTLSTRIFEDVSIGTRGAAPALGSLLLLAAAAPPMIGLAAVLRRRPALSLGVPSQGRTIRASRGPILALCLLAIAAGAVLPIVSLAGQMGGIEASRRAIALGGQPLANSALVAAAAATIAVGAGLLAAAAFPRGGRGRQATWAIGIAAFILPGYLLGRGLTVVYNRPGPLRAIYEEWPILALGLGATFFLPAFAAISAAIAGIPASSEEAASAAGAGPVRRLLRITIPRIRSDLAAVWLVIFTLAFGEPGAAILREPPGFQTAQVFLFNQMHYGRDTDVAALCIFSVAISLIPLIAALLLWRRGAGRGARSGGGLR